MRCKPASLRNWIAGPARGLNPALLVLLLCSITRLWLMPLRSSFWLDEIVTAFVVRYGPAHPSLAAVPRVWKSVYYCLPRCSERVLGFSEAAYRLPSILAMAAALFLVARLAARLIHPQAAWFAVFACLALRGINYEAANARPYALGIAAAAASLLFLVRWLDAGRWSDALVFVAFASLLWRVHLLYWPFYMVLALYAALRAARGGTQVRLAACAVFALLGILLAPPLLDVLALYGDARAHVIAPVPTVREMAGSLQLRLIAAAGGGAWLLRRWFHWPAENKPLSPPSLALILGWWLCQPLCLFAVSRLTGKSVFVPRYLSLALPGAALTATAAAARCVPAARWKALAAVLGAGAVLWLGDWRHQIGRAHV